MRFVSSIRVRFTGWYLIILAILLVGLGVTLHSFLSYTLQHAQDQALQNRAQQLAGSRETRLALEEGRVEEGLGELIAFFQPRGDGYQVTSSRLVENDIELVWIDAALDGTPGFYSVKRNDGTFLRFYISQLLPPSARLPLQEGLPQPPSLTSDREELIEPAGHVVIVVGQPMDRTVAALVALRGILLIAIPLTLLLSAGGGLFLVRRVLKPIDQMIETTRGIEEADLSGRVEFSSDDEFGRLARTLNAMLGRLERAFHRQRQFTDDASHELRSPLAVIEAEATLALRRERVAEDYRESLAIIAEESASMNRLIDQLLTLARGDAGEEAIDYRQIDLTNLITETVNVMQPLAEEEKLKLVALPLERGDLGIRVTGDETQLRRVLTNLVENAICHTEPGGEITVSAEQQESTIEWRVKDTGCGISEDHLPHIFERFYRADTTRSRRSGGSGLGLAISRQIIEAHHGTIVVESELNGGTTFTIQLPTV